MERFCDKCGTLVSGEGKFCPSCGAPLESAVDLGKPDIDSPVQTEQQPSPYVAPVNNTYSGSDSRLPAKLQYKFKRFVKQRYDDRKVAVDFPYFGNSDSGSDYAVYMGIRRRREHYPPDFQQGVSSLDAYFGRRNVYFVFRNDRVHRQYDGRTGQYFVGNGNEYGNALCLKEHTSAVRQTGSVFL